MKDDLHRLSLQRVHWEQHWRRKGGTLFEEIFLKYNQRLESFQKILINVAISLILKVQTIQRCFQIRPPT